MRVCHVLPPRFAHYMMRDGEVVNQMLLVQEEHYLDEAPLRGAAPEGVDPYIVTDSGSWELGTPIGIERLMEFSAFHRANAVVIPDVGGDGAATRRMVCEDVEFLRDFHYQCEPIACCQSLTWDEILEDLETFAELGIQHVGIPSKLVRESWRAHCEPDRLGVLCRLQDVLRDYGMSVHLLGLMEDPREILAIARSSALNSLVVSVDTAAALRWAFFGQYPQWWPQVPVPRWIWESLEPEHLSTSVWLQWAHNRQLLEDWAQGHDVF